MIVTRGHLIDVLELAIDDYSDNDNQINHDEIANIISNFKRVASQLMNDAEDRIEEDEDDEESDDYDEDDVDD